MAPVAGRPHFVLFGTPVRVEPTFFLIAFYLALNERSFSMMLAWVAVLFVGILVHEMGHALAFNRFGSSASVVLWGFGGLTMGAAQPPRRSVVVSLAGPLTGLIVLGLPAWWLSESGNLTNPDALAVVDMVVWVNVFWSLVNLLPMLPLDGGNIARDLITLISKRPGERVARYLSIVTAAGVGLYAWTTWKSTFALIFGGVLVVMNVAALRRPAPSFVKVENPPKARRPNRKQPPLSTPSVAAAGTGVGVGPSPAPPPAFAGADVQQMLISGYQALERDDVDAAIAAAEHALATNPYPDVARHALELEAWAHLREHQVAHAAAAIEKLPAGRKANRYLRAAMKAAADDPAPIAPPPWAVDASGSTDPLALRVADLVDAFLFAGEGPDKVQAAAFCGAWELTDPVVDGLLASGRDGRDQVDRLEEILQQLGRTEAAQRVHARRS